MAKVCVSAIIRTNKEMVYRALRNIEGFPHFLKDLRALSIVASGNGKVISDWKVDIEGTPIEWRQETIFDEANHNRILFRMIEGDYEKYEGQWNLKELSEGITLVELHAEFKWGVPGLERFVGDILEQKACRSLKGMLYALRRKLQRRER